MYERLTDRARKVIAMAVQEAKNRQQNYVGTEHLLLGLFQCDGGTAQDILVEFGLDLEKARSAVDRILGNSLQKSKPHAEVGETTVDTISFPSPGDPLQ